MTDPLYDIRERARVKYKGVNDDSVPDTYFAAIDAITLLTRVDRLTTALREAETEIELRDSALGDSATDINEIRSYAFGDEHDLHPELGKIADRMEGRLDRLAKFEAAFAGMWLEDDGEGETRVYLNLEPGLDKFLGDLYTGDGIAKALATVLPVKPAEVSDV